MTLRSATKTLLILALALPVVQSVLIWVASLLTAMGDADGAAIVRHVGMGCLVIWTVSLVGLAIVVALLVLNERSPEE